MCRGSVVAKCRLSLGLGIIACLGLISLVFHRPNNTDPPRKSTVTRENYERIGLGMTLSEVEIILGGPPGDYRTGEVELEHREADGPFWDVQYDPDVLMGNRHPRHEWWQGDEGTAWVCFDEQNKVMTQDFTPGRLVASKNENPLSRPAYAGH
jgi:hypothetical protein